MFPIATPRTVHAGGIVGWFRTWIRGACLAAVTLALPLAWAPTAYAQVSGSENEALRVFLDCARCDQDFMRTEITYVDFMRDRQDAQVHVLVTTQATGAGTEYTLAFIGLGEFADTDLSLRYAASQTDTADEVRRAFARRLELGLAPFIAGTPVADELAITRRPQSRQSACMVVFSI